MPKKVFGIDCLGLIGDKKFSKEFIQKGSKQSEFSTTEIFYTTAQPGFKDCLVVFVLTIIIFDCRINPLCCIPILRMDSYTSYTIAIHNFRKGSIAGLHQ